MCVLTKDGATEMGSMGVGVLWVSGVCREVYGMVGLK